MEFLVNLFADATKDTQAWTTRLKYIRIAWFWFITIDLVLILISSSIIFFLVVCKRKIRDPFIITQLTCYISCSTAFLSYDITLLYINAEQDTSEFKDPSTLKGSDSTELLHSIGQFFYLLGHWAFASKYLKTS